MHRLYQQGSTLEEVGEEFGITRERVRQLFRQAGLDTRSTGETAALKHAADRLRAEEVVEVFKRTKTVTSVSAELEIPKSTVTKILYEELGLSEYREIAWRPQKKRYADEELVDFLTQASAACSGPLSTEHYKAFARARHTRDGRPLPTDQTYVKRFGSWRGALLAAGLNANPPSAVAGKLRFDKQQCAQSISELQRTLGRAPTAEEYERHARDSQGSLPSLATIRNRFDTWNNALRCAQLSAGRG
ncbi:MAG TPA: sigma factor-like helix-turn-helix DNA-binding protein [Solirubrobacteraceae bacterium]|jgi:hypothetical protein